MVIGMIMVERTVRTYMAYIGTKCYNDPLPPNHMRSRLTALTIFAISLPFASPQSQTVLIESPPVVVQQPLHFELRHLHAVSRQSARVIFSDVLADQIQTSYTINTRSVSTYRTPSSHLYPLSRSRSLFTHGEDEDLPWEVHEVTGPDIEHRATLLHLAKMSNNAYILPDDDAWYDLDEEWDAVSPVPSSLAVGYFFVLFHERFLDIPCGLGTRR